jgi:hypothetical protein
MSNKKQITVSAFKMLEQSFNFNKTRIFEMHRLLKQIAGLKNAPGIKNEIVKNSINEIDQYLKRWEDLKVYPSGIPYSDDKISAWVEDKGVE